jgi:hypothetical protein
VRVGVLVLQWLARSYRSVVVRDRDGGEGEAEDMTSCSMEVKPKWEGEVKAT